MFAVLRRRVEQEHQRHELLAGILSAVTANYSISRPKEPLSPADFMPSLRNKNEEPVGDPSTWDNQAIAEDFLQSFEEYQRRQGFK
jgi:hypothetical protein